MLISLSNQTILTTTRTLLIEHRQLLMFKPLIKDRAWVGKGSNKMQGNYQECYPEQTKDKKITNIPSSRNHTPESITQGTHLMNCRIRWYQWMNNLKRFNSMTSINQVSCNLSSQFNSIEDKNKHRLNSLLRSSNNQRLLIKEGYQSQAMQRMETCHCLKVRLNF